MTAPEGNLTTAAGLGLVKIILDIIWTSAEDGYINGTCVVPVLSRTNIKTVHDSDQAVANMHCHMNTILVVIGTTLCALAKSHQEVKMTHQNSMPLGTQHILTVTHIDRGFNPSKADE